MVSGCVHRPSGATGAQWSQARQLVVVTVSDWNSTGGELRRFERQGEGWKQVDGEAAVSIGRNGAAWGAGLHENPRDDAGPVKKEGDGRSPAGVFEIGEAFGYAATATTGLAYAPMQQTSWCIDVPGSPLYNRVVDSREVGEAAVQGSSEPMRRDLHLSGDQAYRVGFVVQHNPARVPQTGSCIFVHQWKAPGAPTAGCTALAADALDALLAWLDAKQRPVFVLLPRAQYERLRGAWNLPELASK